MPPETCTRFAPDDKPTLFGLFMWNGCLSDASHSEPLEWCRAGGAEIAHIHTSGHASAADLRAFARAVDPEAVVPVHGENWDYEAHGFGPIRRLADAEAMVID